MSASSASTRRTRADGCARASRPCLSSSSSPLRPKGLKALLGPRRRPVSPAPLDPDELPDDPRGAVEAGLELFNESGHPRTVSGIARTLGDPRVSVVQRNASEVVVTVAWDLSWYQYRVDMLGPAAGDAASPGRGAGRDRVALPGVERDRRGRRHRRPRQLVDRATRRRTRRSEGTCPSARGRRRLRVSRRSSTTSPSPRRRSFSPPCATVDDHLHVGVLGVVLRHPVEELALELARYHAVDHP